MLKKITVLCLIGYSGIVCAQQNTPFVTDANGRPLITTAGNYISDGSPFLFEEYYPSEIIFQNNKVYNNVKARLNLADNQILFTDDAGNEMAVSTPVKSMKIMKPGSQEIFLDGQGASINVTRTPVYQVLVNNEKLKLLKQISITYTETRGYGESGITRTYKKRESFFAVFTGQALQKVEQNKNAVAALFGSKQQQVATYIEEKKFRFKTEADLINVFEYFLTLQ
ncbi:hypothetical protein LZZ85_09240 [Terrimonas sp. NA20]|uniref:DUF4968 domain-containing protein n=1 Tax=Terrimonas ginsenosidimutans TaxID=2908004 RepID=A0ABS9KQ57_9BACT|nr:hypothetical protein [Terrimonas ginsenosidimutans]MCG2614464.1 hypothetical protein [Terrimonas ginsenosidimutans]